MVNEHAQTGVIVSFYIRRRKSLQTDLLNALGDKRRPANAVPYNVLGLLVEYSFSTSCFSLAC